MLFSSFRRRYQQMVFLVCPPYWCFGKFAFICGKRWESKMMHFCRLNHCLKFHNVHLERGGGGAWDSG